MAKKRFSIGSGRNWPGIAPKVISKIYVARVLPEKNTARIYTDQSDEGLEASLWGEVEIYGHPSEDGQRLVVERLLRVAVLGRLVIPDDPEKEKQLDKRVRTFSLNGPKSPTGLNPDSKGTPDAFEMDLYYTALSDWKYDPENYHEPELEIAAGKLTWESLSELDDQGGVVMQSLQLNIREPDKRLMGVIRQMELTFGDLSFQRVRQIVKESRPPMSRMLILNLNPGVPPASTGVPLNSAQIHTLTLKFIDCSDNAPDIESLISNQFNTACTAWSSQAAVALAADPNVEDGNGTQYMEFTNFDTSSANSPQSVGTFNNTTTRGMLQVYFVKSLDVVINNVHITTAACLDALTASPYIVISIGAARVNTGLLAHELTHLLKLVHPLNDPTLDPATDLPSSYQSVTQPAPVSPPPNQSTNNTLYNCRPFNSSNPSLHALFVPTNAAASYLPGGTLDGDFQLNSIWNRVGAPAEVSNPNNAVYENPKGVDRANTVFVGLQYQNSVWNPVNIDFFYGRPGLSRGRIVLDPINPAGNRVFYDPQDKPQTQPVSFNLEWHPNMMPEYWSKHASIYALASVPEVAHPVLPTSPVTFNLIASCLGKTKQVAQINQNLIPVSTGRAGAFASLPWLEIGNPFANAGGAGLSLTGWQASGLTALEVEVEGQGPQRLMPADPGTVPLNAPLGLNDVRTLRVTAHLPGGMTAGQSFNIQVNLSVSGQVVSLYQYTLRVRPLADVVNDTLDWLYGALRAVAAGCRVEDARGVAESVKNIMDRYPVSDKGNPRAGCSPFPPKPDPKKTALGELSELADRIERLAIPIETSTDALISQACQHIHGLAGVLRNMNTPDDQKVELIREEVDHIYEPASRLAFAQVHP